MSAITQLGVAVFFIAVVLGAAVLVLRARERRFRGAHAELSEMKRRMHEGLALSSMSMFTVGRDGIISSFVGRRVPDTRLSMTTCVGLPAEELLRTWPEWWQATLLAQRGTASTLLVEVGEVALEVACGPIRDDAAQTTGALVMVRDNTEGHIDHERAEHLAEMRSTALATINHKLRGQLNGMLGIMDLLQTKRLTKQQIAWLELATGSGHQLLDFLHHLIELMELEAGRLDLNEDPFSLRQQLDEVVAAQRERADAEQTTLALRYPIALSEHFIGDAERVHELMALLLGVALRTNAGGEVLVNVEEDQTDIEESVVVVSVEDRGRGLSAEALTRIFDGLESPSAMWATRSGGTGLELAVAKLMASALGGGLLVESAKGVGTTLRLRLPLQRTAVVFPATEQGESVTSADDAPALRVLLVDDSQVQQQVAVSLLQQLGHAVTVANNGAEALDLLDDDAFDLMITELHMPVTDGFEATAAIRGRSDSLSELPIVAATSDTRPLMRRQSRESGMDGFLEKPLQLERLRLRLGEVRRARHAAEAAGSDGDLDVIDREAIARLEELDPSGDAELLRELLGAFLAATPRQLLQIRDAALALDPVQLGPPLRSVSTSCRLLGARRMERACARLERAVEQGELLAARSGADALMAEFNQLRRVLPSIHRADVA